MPSILTPNQIAFDAAVKAWRDGLYTGIADLEALREANPSLGTRIDELIVIRDGLNAALAVEGRSIVGDAPPAPFYLDYLDALTSNARAFRDADHSFIGVTIPLIDDADAIAKLISASDAVVAAINVPDVTDRQGLKAVLFWMLLSFVVCHEYAHHAHGHLLLLAASRRAGDELKRQAYEADADGWAAYLVLNQWVLSGGRPAVVKLLRLEDAPTSTQDVIAFSCFVVTQAAFTFLRVPLPLDRFPANRQTHPIQPLRLNLMSRFVIKFSNEFRAAVQEVLTQSWYQSLMDEVTRLMWTSGTHAARWRQHAEYLQTPDGVAYSDALIDELDAFRNTLREWQASASTPEPKR